MTPIRLAVVCDLPEEGWASMDLTGEQVLNHLGRECPDEVAAVRVCPPFRNRLSRGPASRFKSARNADRLLNRFLDYPRALRKIVKRGEFDLYHVVDHSYSQLVHEIPAGRAVVTCHDLDTFRCLLDPDREPRPRWFRAMAGHVLAGFRRAAAVVCNSETTRAAVHSHHLIPEERLHVVPLGVDPSCSPNPDPAADAEVARRLGPVGAPLILHVGSTIPRKRIDLLLEVFAAIRRADPTARMVKAGGSLTADQFRHADRLGVADALTPLPFLSRPELSALYRRADLVLQPSEAEGLGLPVVEALACGATVLASDIPALRESGGGAAVYQPVGDVPAWCEAARTLLEERRGQTANHLARRAAGLAQAERFQWPEHARRLASIYRAVLAT